jgi:hypothetical protein
MRRRRVFLYPALGCCLALSGQDASLDLLIYESFFSAVSQLMPGKAMGRTVGPGQQIALIGQMPKLVQPGLEDALGITAEEARMLRAIAVDYAAKDRAIYEAQRPLVLELRFAAIAEEPRPQSVDRRFNELNRQRAEMVLDHIQALKTAFGQARFPLIETFLSTRKNSGSFFPAVPQAAVH